MEKKVANKVQRVFLPLRVYEVFVKKQTRTSHFRALLSESEHRCISK